MSEAMEDATFEPILRYDGWERDDSRIEGLLHVPPERGFRPYPLMLDVARRIVSVYGLDLRVLDAKTGDQDG